MATRSEEHRLARWCLKHYDELLNAGADVPSLLNVLRNYDPEIIPSPRLRGRRYGRVTNDNELEIDSLGKIGDKDFIEYVCWIIKITNCPESGIITVSDRCHCYIPNKPEGFARLIVAFKKICPGYENKALFRLVKRELDGYNVGCYSTFSYHCSDNSEAFKNECLVLAKNLETEDWSL